MQMEYCQNGEAVRALGEIDSIGEMAEERPANLVFQLRKLPRVGFDAPEHLIEFIEKPHAQAGSLVFVPHSSCLDV